MDVMNHEFVNRSCALLQCIHRCNLPALQRFDGLAIDGSSYRLHQEEGQNQSQPDQGLVARRGLQPQRLTQKVEDNQQPRERRHAQQQ